MRVWQQVVYAVEGDGRTGWAGVVVGPAEEGLVLVQWDNGETDAVIVADLRAL